MAGAAHDIIVERDLYAADPATRAAAIPDFVEEGFRRAGVTPRIYNSMSIEQQTGIIQVAMDSLKETYGNYFEVKIPAQYGVYSGDEAHEKYNAATDRINNELNDLYRSPSGEMYRTGGLRDLPKASRLRKELGKVHSRFEDASTRPLMTAEEEFMVDAFRREEVDYSKLRDDDWPALAPYANMAGRAAKDTHRAQTGAYLRDAWGDGFDRELNARILMKSGHGLSAGVWKSEENQVEPVWMVAFPELAEVEQYSALLGIVAGGFTLSGASRILTKVGARRAVNLFGEGALAYAYEEELPGLAASAWGLEEGALKSSVEFAEGMALAAIGEFIVIGIAKLLGRPAHEVAGMTAREAFEAARKAGVPEGEIAAMRFKMKAQMGVPKPRAQAGVSTMPEPGAELAVPVTDIERAGDISRVPPQRMLPGGERLPGDVGPAGAPGLPGPARPPPKLVQEVPEPAVPVAKDLDYDEWQKTAAQPGQPIAKMQVPSYENKWRKPPPESDGGTKKVYVDVGDGLKFYRANLRPEDIRLSDDVPQFKEGADPVTGEVAGEEIKHFNPKYASPIHVWERLDGSLEVISGRHRWASAGRTKGIDTLDAKVYKEADGFNKYHAATLDAELNIADGNGTIKDYAEYFRNKNIDEATAEARGLLDRNAGFAGFILGKHAEDELYTLYRNGRISQTKATAIADGARGNAGAQFEAIKKAKDLSAGELKVFAQQANDYKPTAGLKGEEQMGLFGKADPMEAEFTAIAKAISEMKAERKAKVTAAKNAAKNPKAAKAMGIDVDDPGAVHRQIGALEDEIKALDTVHARSRPDVRKRAGLDPLDAPTAKPTEAVPPKQGDMVGVEAASKQDARTTRPIGAAADGEGTSFFGGIPLAMKGLRFPAGSVVYAAVGRGLKAFGRVLKREFIAGGALPRMVFQAKLKMSTRLSRIAHGMKANQEDLDRVIREYADAQGDIKLGKGGEPGMEIPDEYYTAINDALGGKIKISSLPQSWRPVVQNMRDHIDALTDELIASGAVAGDLKATVIKNRGTYMHRSYQIFDDPKGWAKKVPQEVINKAEAFIRREFPAYSDDQIQGIIKNLLHRAEGSPSKTLGAMGEKDLSIFKKRKGIPAEIRALWGEYKDPFVNYGKSVLQMAHTLEAHKFLTKVRDIGLKEGWASLKPTAKHFMRPGDEGAAAVYREAQPGRIREFELPGNQRKDPMSDIYVSKEMRSVLDSLEELGPVQSDVWRHVLKMAGLVQAGKTVGSPVTHARNFTSNIVIVAGQGYFDPRYLKVAAETIMKDLTGKGGKVVADRLEHLIDLGVAHNSVRAGDIDGILKDAGFRNASANMDRMAETVAKRLKRRLGKAGDKLIDIYGAEDDFWKIFGYYSEAARYSKAMYGKAFADLAGAEKVAVEEIASGIIQNVMPTYTRVSKFIKRLRRMAFIGNYVSFPWEIWRTSGNTLRIGLSEIRHANPAIQKIGATRLASFMGIAVMGSYAAALGSRYMFGVSAQQDEDARTHMAPWEQNQQIFWTGRNEDGKLRYINLGYQDPYAYLKQPIIAAMRALDSGEPIDEALYEAGKDYLTPFVGERILASSIVDALRNVEGSTGAGIYNEVDDNSTKIAKIAQHLWDSNAPGIVNQVDRLHKSITGEVSPTGRKYKLSDELWGSIGIRLRTVDVQESMRYITRDFTDQKRQTASIFNREARGWGRGATNVSAESLVASYREANKKRMKAYAEFRRATRSSVRLGVTWRELNTIITGSGGTKADVKSVYSNLYPGIKPSKDILIEINRRPGGREVTKAIAAEYQKLRGVEILVDEE